MLEPAFLCIANSLDVAGLQSLEIADEVWPPITAPNDTDGDWLFHVVLYLFGLIAAIGHYLLNLLYLRLAASFLK